jgi:3-methyladenine DNA glycosylase AlkD
MVVKSMKQELIQIFEENKDIYQSQKMSAYMQNKFAFYGIPAPIRKTIEKPFFKEIKKCPIPWDELKEIYLIPYREMQYFVLDYLEIVQKKITLDDFEKIEFLVDHFTWWDSIDKLDKIIGNIDCHSEVLDQFMIRWSISSNFWHRRLAIDHQMARKKNTNEALLETIIVNNLNQTEFFINKAIGWSLREYKKTNPEWVEQFLIKYDAGLSTLSKKEARK